MRIVAFVSASQTVYVYDMNDSRTYPTSVVLGLAWPVGEQVSWVASTVGPYASMDELTSQHGGLALFGLGRDVTLGTSQSATFFAE